MDSFACRITLFVLLCLSLAGMFVGVQHLGTSILPVSSISTLIVGFLIALREFAKIDHVG